ncbi:hypothetical protein ABBQ32_007088 [Trebouxia sp. C0010 RCD-2024]
MLGLPASHKRCGFCQRSGCKGKWHGSTAGGLVKGVSVFLRCYTRDYRAGVQGLKRLGSADVRPAPALEPSKDYGHQPQEECAALVSNKHTGSVTGPHAPQTDKPEGLKQKKTAQLPNSTGTSLAKDVGTHSRNTRLRHSSDDTDVQKSGSGIKGGNCKGKDLEGKASGSKSKCKLLSLYSSHLTTPLC